MSESICESTTSTPLRVLVVDDQALMRSGFALMLSAEDDIEVVGEAANGEEAISQVRELQPDVVLMDVQMPGINGIEATKQIVAEKLSRVLVLTTFDRDDYLFAALEAGSSGFLLKNSDPEELITGVRAVGCGHALLTPSVTRRVISRMTTAEQSPSSDGATTAAHSAKEKEAAAARIVATLTAREREVLVAVAQGLSNAEIAASLQIAETTVKTHVSAVLMKANLRDRVQAVVLAYRSGLVQP